MACSACGKDNGLTITEGGEAVSLCPDCLDKRWPALRLGELTQSLRRPTTQGKCPFCGTTDKQALDTGLVGCPLCYEALSARVWQELGQN